MSERGLSVRPEDGDFASVRGKTAFAWLPTAQRIACANATRLPRRAEVGDWSGLVRRAGDDPDWFWPIGSRHGSRVLSSVEHRR